ncbi:cation:proton antiporter [Sphingomonas sp. AP4-R1]|uniref:cation:proton antiporter n=1 Tax=Sphingomonas sp. AP4-R1 TaxID=2735134 RepID=UPI001493BC93|nr:cation:proton antiporter [Sphingomonas sp. AP4-R1]QJU59123.1 cation:proton antiporter [Sphingomonas sp. AP4-R1]
MLLFGQIALILLLARCVGWIGRRWLGQPQVVGEMLAGVLLGPSVFGALLPGLQATIFPAGSRPVLQALGQFGIALYMFLIGTHFRTDLFRHKARGAFAVSLAGIATPFLVAVPLAALLIGVPGLFVEGLSRPAATLFLGACISLTAFPMLARIIDERGLSNSQTGTLLLSAAAFDDACSWGVLAIVLALFERANVAILAIAGGIGWTLLVLFGAPLLFAPLARRVEQAGGMSGGVLAITLALFCVSAFVTDAIGLHAVFGAFLLGTRIPRGAFAEGLQQKLDGFVSVALLPLFFTYSGLVTRFDLLVGASLLPATLLLLVASIASKGGACFVASRIAGEDRRTAFGIGALMNARGMMELIIIGIGLEKGIIGAPLHAMLALMTIVTTMAAGPAFDWVRRGRTDPLSAPGGGAASARSDA